MKKMKYWGMFFCLVFFSTSIFAQKSTLPKKVFETFNKKYQQVEEVEWEVKSKSDYKITFELEGKKTVVEIDEDGTWEKTSTHISFDELPQVVQTTVNEQKKTWKSPKLRVL